LSQYFDEYSRESRSAQLDGSAENTPLTRFILNGRLKRFSRVGGRAGTLTLSPGQPRILVMVLVLLSVFLQAEANHVLRTTDLQNIRTVQDVAIAPDGKLIAYTLSVPRQPFVDGNGAPWVRLYVADRNGSSRGLVTGRVNVSAISWLPNGKHISYLMGNAGSGSLYVISPYGGHETLILSHRTGILAYTWSPNGTHVAFLAAKDESEYRKKLDQHGYNSRVYGTTSHRIEVWIADLRPHGEGQKSLDLPGSASELHWSPDGSHLVVAFAPTDSLDDGYMHRRVWLVDSAARTKTASVDNSGKLGQIAWSPDGKYLALISASDLHDPLEGRLMIASSRGGEMQDILPSYLGHVKAIQWKNPNTLLFLADEGVRTTLQQIRRDGSERADIWSSPVEVADSFSLSEDGRWIALTSESSTHPPEAFVMTAGTEPHRVTDSNPWLNGVNFGRQEAITFSARDGLQIEGILIHPLNEKKGARYPLIVVVHGGPEEHYSNGWNTDYWNVGQLAAVRGFAVLYPNYRGSTGRGVAYSELDHKDPAGKEFDDLVDGVDFLVASGLVDKNRVGITGLSYGGYAAAWGATYYSERFAASVVIAGISDAISQAGSSGNPDELYLVHREVQPWENWELFLHRSPIFYADKCRTPTLILQGVDDPVVAGSQAVELYNYLRWRAHAPVRLVLYPGEGHEFSSMAAQLDLSLRQLQWMEYFLKGSGSSPPPEELDYADAGAPAVR